MACVIFYMIGMILLFGFEVILGSLSSNFPLENCSTEEIDILFLLSKGSEKQQKTQLNLINTFVKHMSSRSNDNTDPRVLFAAVKRRLCDDTNGDLNISSWSFNTTLEIHEPSECEQNYLNLQFAIEMKIQFVQRLFSEMLGVRKNATHIAIIFLNGEYDVFHELSGLPEILQKQETHIKIFVVVLVPNSAHNLIHMNDTIIVQMFERTNVPMYVLSMAICKECPKGWFLYEYQNSIDYLSCYLLSDNDREQFPMGEYYSCTNIAFDSFLTAIETEDELIFLRTVLSSYFRERVNNNRYTINSTQSVFQIFTRLQRKSTVPTRFRWAFLPSDPPSNPLVINNWLPGKPENDTDCVAWQFVWNENKNTSDTLVNNSYFVDGWLDVHCFFSINVFAFCEIVLPSRLEIFRINAASSTSFTQTLSRGYFTILEGNIVSISAIMKDSHYRNDVNQIIKGSFPVFDCGEDDVYPRYISYLNLCDGVDDCNNRRDESICTTQSRDDLCTHKKTTDYMEKCSGVQCCDGSCLPVQFVNDGEIDCKICSCKIPQLNDETRTLNKYLKDNMTCAFICNKDTCVTFDQLNDSKKDCQKPGVVGELENWDETIGKLERANTCYNILGHVIWAPRCVYLKDKYGNIIGCRDVSHLNNCSEFKCQEGYFKCRNNYCIPQHYVLDQTEDCPKGEDERNDMLGPCTGNFKCIKSEVCLHPDLVCDGHPECPDKDDELDCNMKCTDGFSCVSGTVTVSNYNRSIPLMSLDFIDERTRYMDLSGIDLSYINSFSFDQLKNLKELKLSNCKLNEFPTSLTHPNCQIYNLDISYNMIHILNIDKTSCTFKYLRYLNMSNNKELDSVTQLSLKFLEILDLSHTGLTSLNRNFFAGLPNLKYVNLSWTLITDVYAVEFPKNLTMQTLDLRGVYMTYFHVDLFHGLTITKNLYTDTFEMCCPQILGDNILSETCQGPGNAISSCFDLVGIGIQRVLLWIFVVLAVFGNLTVIVYRIIWDRSVFTTVYGLFVTNLGISDLIMGVYLCIIAGADYKYRDVYVLYDKIWRESLVCKLAGFLATLSIETSTYFIFLITLDRFLIMKFPFGQIKFSIITKSIALLLSWIIGLIVALIPVVFKFEIYSSNAMCVGLPLKTQRLNGWEYSFAVFIVCNFIMFLVIAYGQTAIFRAMSNNRMSKTTSSTSSRLAKDIIVAKQLSLVLLANFLCWFPVGLMGLLTLAGHETSNDAYAWITVIILPINSAANPIIYTIPVIMDKWEKFKNGKTSHHSNSS